MFKQSAVNSRGCQAPPVAHCSVLDSNSGTRVGPTKQGRNMLSSRNGAVIAEDGWNSVNHGVIKQGNLVRAAANHFDYQITNQLDKRKYI